MRTWRGATGRNKPLLYLNFCGKSRGTQRISGETPQIRRVFLPISGVDFPQCCGIFLLFMGFQGSRCHCAICPFEEQHGSAIEVPTLFEILGGNRATGKMLLWESGVHPLALTPMWSAERLAHLICTQRNLKGSLDKVASRRAEFFFTGLEERQTALTAANPKIWETDFYPVRGSGGGLCSPYEVARPQPSTG